MKAADRLRYDKTLDTQKRIATGSFYTPPQLAEFMVCLSLSQRLSKGLPNMEASKILAVLQPQGVEDFEPVRLPSEEVLAIGKALKSIRVLDLCAGSGVFPLAYLRILSNFFIANGLETERGFNKLAAKLSKNIYALDIQPEPLQLYADELKALYEMPSKSIRTFCIDALSDEELEKIPLLKAEWEKGFDLILGNPPYLGEKNHKEIFQALRNTAFGEKYYEGRMDYFYFFIYRGLEALKKDGQLCMITTNYFATADGAKFLRAYLQEHTHWNAMINFNDCALFKDALGQHNMIFSLSKSKGSKASNTCSLCYPKGKEVSLESLYDALIQNGATADWDYENHPSRQCFDSEGMLKIFPSRVHQGVLDKLQYEDSNPRATLGELFHVQQGIVSGYDRNFKADQGVFVLSNEEAKAHPDLAHYLKPFYKNSQIRKYAVNKPTQYEILYVSEALDLTLKPAKALSEHLKPYYERLSLRREVVKGIRPWYALQWPREPWRFDGPLIAAPQRAFVNVFAYEADQLHGSADIYYISDKGSDDHRVQRTLFMTAYLNTPIIYYWLALKGKRKGSMLELYATPLKGIPILTYNPEHGEHQAIVTLTQSVLSALKEGTRYEALAKGLILEIHEIFYKLLAFSPSERATVETFYESMGAATAEENYWYTK